MRVRRREGERVFSSSCLARVYSSKSTGVARRLSWLVPRRSTPRSKGAANRAPAHSETACWSSDAPVMRRPPTLMMRSPA